MSERTMVIGLIILLILIGYNIISNVKPNPIYIGKVETITNTQTHTVRIQHILTPTFTFKTNNIYKIHTTKNGITIAGTIDVNKLNDSLTFDLNIITLPKTIKNSLYYRENKLFINTEIDSVNYEQPLTYDPFKKEEISKWDRAYVGAIAVLVVCVTLLALVKL
jgi:hypothetical protein